MKFKFLVAIVVVAGLGFFALQNRSEAPLVDAKNTNAANMSSAPKLGASSVLNIDPKIQSAPRAQAIVPKTSLSADMQLLRDKKDWPLLYQRVKNGPQTSEALYIQAELLESCAKRPPSDDPKKVDESREIKREKFIKNLIGKDEQKSLRITAYDALNVDACGELRSIEYSKDEVARLAKAAAEAGNPIARAWRLQVDIAKASSDDYNMRNNIKPDATGKMPQRTDGYMMSDQQWAATRELLATGNPTVIADLRAILSSSMTDGSIRIGPDKEPIENRAFYSALALAACDMGNDCGTTNTELLSDCAYRNRCGANSLQDLTYFYDASPHDAQLVERYRQIILDAIRTGDFTNLDLIRGPQDRRSTFLFGNRRQ